MKNVFLLLFLLTGTFVFSQDKNPYAKFKTGTFLYQAGKELVVVKRTKKKQIESFSGGKIVLNVEWTSDSTFTLTVKKMKGSPGCLSKGDWIKIKIIKIEGKKFTAKFSSEFCGFGETTFTKVEEEL